MELSVLVNTKGLGREGGYKERKEGKREIEMEGKRKGVKREDKVEGKRKRPNKKINEKNKAKRRGIDNETNTMTISYFSPTCQGGQVVHGGVHDEATRGVGAGVARPGGSLRLTDLLDD